MADDLKLREVIDRGRVFSGSKLLAGLEIAARSAPAGGAGTITKQTSIGSVVQAVGKAGIPPRPIWAILKSTTPAAIPDARYQDGSGNPTAWRYGWDEAIEAGNEFILKPGGRSNGLPGFFKCRNLAELGNNGDIVRYGVDLASPAPASSLLIQPIAGGSIVTLDPRRAPNGQLELYFTATNEILPIC